MKFKIVLNVVALAALGTCFQNCSKVGFVSEQSNQAQLSSGIVPGSLADAFPGQHGVDGITGGHFDLDTSTMIYSAGKGTTNHHTHEYDKLHQTTEINFFDLLEAQFDTVQDAIPVGKKFVINVVNASLSPGGVLALNGKSSKVANGRLAPVYVIGGAAGVGETLLNDFRLGFSPDVLANKGLVPTETGCVRANDPGAKGEYRSGALTIQALDAAAHTIDPATGAASSGLLWEATVFWHWKGGCY